MAKARWNFMTLNLGTVMANRWLKDVSDNEGTMEHMSSENPIRCHPPATPLWHWVLAIVAAVAVFGSLIFAGLFMIVELCSNQAASPQTKLMLFILSGMISVILLVLFIHWEHDRWFWTLTGEALIGGRKQTQQIPLSSISLIVPGLPEKAHLIVEANRFINPQIWQGLIHERRLALLLKFADGSFMPLHVHRCVEGRTLMSALIQRLANRIDPDYVYSPREVKALRAADWNRVVKYQAG